MEESFELANRLTGLHIADRDLLNTYPHSPNYAIVSWRAINMF